VPKFSVIIPTYNRAHYLGEALGSVLAQTYRDYEVILVDDGSTDETKAVAARFGSNIRYLYQANQGRSAARNSGLMAAQGEIIAFLDSDDQWAGDKLERQFHYFEKNPEISMVHGLFEIIGENGESIPDLTSHVQSDWAKAHARGDTYENWALQCCCILSTVAVRTEVLQAVGIFDPAILANEELDLYLRIAARYQIGFLENPTLAYYRIHESNSGSENLAKGAIQVANKHLALLDTIPFPVNRQHAKQNFQLSLSKSFFQLGDGKNGRHYFLTSALRNPRILFTPPFSRLYFASLLPNSLRTKFATLRQQLFPTPFEQAIGGTSSVVQS